MVVYFDLRTHFKDYADVAVITSQANIQKLLIIYNLGHWQADNDAHYLILCTVRKLAIYKSHFWLVELSIIK